MIRLPVKISRSIGLMQAVCVLLASLLIGTVMSMIELRSSLAEQQRATRELQQDILTLAQGGATAAAWTLDRMLAEEVVDSIMAIRGVRSAEIRDDKGEVLAVKQRPDGTRGPIVTWFAARFVESVTRGERDLFVRSGGEPLAVGRLVVSLTPYFVADRFRTLATSTILATFIASLLIGFVLLRLSSWLITAPLRRAANAIAAFDPEHANDTGVAVPALHRHNELGHLLDHTNSMLERFSRQRDELRYMATRDSLTGLPNRALIRERLDSAIAQARRNGQLVAVLFLDLDRFKTVNDSLGHDVGDQLLVSVASTLAARVRSNDTVGRLGGDEFVIVLIVDHIKEVVAMVQRIADGLDGPFNLGGHEIPAAASIGIAVHPNDGDDATTLMRQADLAMYKAKKTAVGKWFFFSHELSDSVQTRLRLESALAGAVTHDEFVLFYQPKFYARGDGLAGAEALLRWRRDGELVAAGEFIPIAEESALIIKIGDWVVERVCQQLHEWDQAALPISVNVSARQLNDDGFVDRVLDALQRHQVSPALLELEITETMLMRDVERSIEVLGRLKKAGVQISIDDFGTGYSSLSYLNRLPIDWLKIDRAFVSGTLRSPVLLTTIVAMAKTLGLRTVAEGVETDEQRVTLVDEGCDVLQGYLLGRPVAGGEFESLHLHGNRVTREDARRGSA